VCHLLLLLPLLALPVFWLMPLSVAVPVYVLVLVLSAAVYYLAIRAMHLPVRTGKEELLHAVGMVTGRLNGGYQVRVHSELWNAESTDGLSPGDRVEVVAVKHMRLGVRRLTDPWPEDVAR